MPLSKVSWKNINLEFLNYVIHNKKKLYRTMKRKENETIIENRGYFRPDEVVMSREVPKEHIAVAVYEQRPITSSIVIDPNVPNAVYLP